jgi:Na+-translocating ferredoxin:NAD+ oxidoreductase RnfG subunit
MIKRKAALLFAIFVTVTSGFAQHSNAGKKQAPVFKEISGLEIIKSVYPSATAVEKNNGVWFGIVDANKKVIGYCLSSKPFSDGIIGYNNTTPVLVITDMKKVIQKVAILSNWETAAYVGKLQRQTFFDTWNGMKVSDALKKKAPADSYSGATITATALLKNLEIILTKANQN